MQSMQGSEGLGEGDHRMETCSHSRERWLQILAGWCQVRYDTEGGNTWATPPDLHF